MQEKYGDDFFVQRHQRTIYSAETILSKVLKGLPPVQSAVDFGCGVGTWLSVLKEQGVDRVHGYDGPWVNTEYLEIPACDFSQVDLESEVKPEQRFDLAMTLEVAEHLRPEAAETFVKTLTNAADFVLFSAAIPSQGGKHHVNEQWQEYWVELFEAQGYSCADYVRQEIWNDAKISTWYRQNILMFVKQERLNELQLPAQFESSLPLSVVHPEMYLSKVDQMSTFKGSLKAFRRSVKKWFKKAA